MNEENGGNEGLRDCEPDNSSLDGSDGQEDPKPPDSKKFQLELDKLIGVIRDKEIALKSLEKHASSTVVKRKDAETLKSELENLRTQREQEIQGRKQFDLDLKGLNMQVLKKNDACTKLQAGLRYKSEPRIDEAVRRLEHQMQVQQLKLSEEKRIVAEIDLLRRSKRNLSEYLVLKQDVDQLRRKLKISRTQRDACVRRISGLKSKEEEIKNLLDTNVAEEGDEKSEQEEQLSEIELLKKELDELHSKKKIMRNSFSKEKSEYYGAIKESRIQKQREESAKKKTERLALLKEVSINRAKKEPFIKEKALCDTLISHMERLHTSTGIHLPDVQDAQSAADKDPAVALSPGFESSSPPGEGVFLRRKSAADDMIGVYAGLGKITRKGSKKGRRSSAKEVPRKLNLHPQVVEHLLALGLSPPSTAADIPKVLEELQEKKEFYEGSSSLNATAEQTNEFMSPITEESAPEFPAKYELSNDSKVSMETETGDVESGVDSSLSDGKCDGPSDSTLPVASGEEKLGVPNEHIDKSANSETVESAESAESVESDESILSAAVLKGRSTEVNEVLSIESCENSVSNIGSLSTDDENSIPTEINNTCMTNGLEPGHIRPEEQGRWNEAVTNCVVKASEGCEQNVEEDVEAISNCVAKASEKCEQNVEKENEAITNCVAKASDLEECEQHVEENNEAVTNGVAKPSKDYEQTVEENDSGINELQSKASGGHNEGSYSSVLQKDAFRTSLPGFMNQEAPNMEEKCPA